MTPPVQKESNPPDKAASAEASTGAAAPRRASPTRLITVVVIGALAVTLGVLATAISGLSDFFDTASTNVEATSEPTVAALATLAVGSGPASQFDEGQYLVQHDIQPGIYEATVPTNSAGCRWERNSTTDGTASSVLESGRGESGERMVVAIKATDKIFHSQGCGTWRRASD